MSENICTTLSPCIPKPGVDKPMEELTCQFRAHVRDIADAKFPWLFPLLLSCEALIYVAPKTFQFSIPCEPGVWHAVPEVAALITEIPWSVDQSQIH